MVVKQVDGVVIYFVIMVVGVVQYGVVLMFGQFGQFWQLVGDIVGQQQFVCGQYLVIGGMYFYVFCVGVGLYGFGMYLVYVGVIQQLLVCGFQQFGVVDVIQFWYFV